MTQSALPNIDAVAAPTANERARQAFVSSLRKAALVDMGGAMKRVYETDIAPAFEKAQGRKPDHARDIRGAMEAEAVYKFFSSLRYNAQEMVWESVRPQIERHLPEMIAIADRADAERPVGGTLRLDPGLKVPRYVTELDVHLMPGCFHSEHAPRDVAQGALYTYGVGVFYGCLKMMKAGGGPAASIAQLLKYGYPDFKPATILDIGCTAGANTFPYVDAFPDTEVYGVDVGAPVLRYGHARAEATGRKVHFSQQNAEALDFPDGSFDFVTSSFFLHEIPLKSTRAVFKECRRVLKPGGLMLHFELPPASLVDPYADFYLDWDTHNNNEPSYAKFRAQKPEDLVREAGFAPENYMQKQIYNWGAVPDATFIACAKGETEAPIVANGGSWFTFGAWKQPAK
jgi:ubiquinone/menaquinone biosynthesis C-methylase UbiE